jgi:hypothetical protein
MKLSTCDPVNGPNQTEALIANVGVRVMDDDDDGLVDIGYRGSRIGYWRDGPEKDRRW